LRPDPADVRGGARLAAAGRPDRHHGAGSCASGPRRRRGAVAPSGRAGRPPERRRPAPRPDRRRRSPAVEPGGTGATGRGGGGDAGLTARTTSAHVVHAVILGLDPRIERRGALFLAAVTLADNPILGSSPRMTERRKLAGEGPHRMNRLRSTFFARSPTFSRTLSPSKVRVWPDRSEALKLVSSSTRSI